MKLKELRIDRRRWVRGHIGGRSALLNEEGNMCCLGFACRKEGIPEKDLKDVLNPFQVKNSRERVLSLVTKRGYNRKATGDAVDINDNTIITEQEREAQLKPVLAKLGYKVVFTGPQ